MQFPSNVSSAGYMEQAHADMFEAEANRIRQQTRTMQRIDNAGLQATADAARQGKANDVDAIMQNVIPRIATIDPERAATIEKGYYDAKQHQMDYQTSQVNHHMTNQLMGMQLIDSGDVQNGLKILNQFAPPGQGIKEMTPVGNGKFRETMEDGTSQIIDSNKTITALTDAKTQFNAMQDMLRVKIRLQKEFGPQAVGAGEVVAPDGTRYKTSDLLHAYSLANSKTLGQIATLQADPTKAMIMKSTPEGKAQYDQLMQDAANLKDPEKWVKEHFKVDITGGGASRTVPGPIVGGKKGTVVAKTPEEIRQSDQKEMVESRGYTYNPDVEYRLDENGKLQFRNKE